MRIIYFAWVKERLGRGEEHLTVPEAVLNIAELVEFLSEKDSAYQEAFADLNKLRFALDQNFVPIEAPIGNASELAIFPPVTGG